MAWYFQIQPDGWNASDYIELDCTRQATLPRLVALLQTLDLNETDAAAEMADGYYGQTITRTLRVLVEAESYTDRHAECSRLARAMQAGGTVRFKPDGATLFSFFDYEPSPVPAAVTIEARRPLWSDERVQELASGAAAELNQAVLELKFTTPPFLYGEDEVLQNICPNGSFEQWYGGVPVAWDLDGSGATVTQVDGVVGQSACRFYIPEDFGAIKTLSLADNLTVSSSTIYNVAFMARHTPSSTPFMSMRARGATGNYGELEDDEITSTEWTRYNMRFLVPRYAGWVDIQFRGGTYTASEYSECDIDGVHIQSLEDFFTFGIFDTDTNGDGLADNWTAIGSPTLTMGGGDQLVRGLIGEGIISDEFELKPYARYEIWRLTTRYMLESGQFLMEVLCNGVVIASDEWWYTPSIESLEFTTAGGAADKYQIRLTSMKDNHGLQFADILIVPLPAPAGIVSNTSLYNHDDAAAGNLTGTGGLDHTAHVNYIDLYNVAGDFPALARFRVLNTDAGNNLYKVYLARGDCLAAHWDVANADVDNGSAQLSNNYAWQLRSRLTPPSGGGIWASWDVDPESVPYDGQFELVVLGSFTTNIELRVLLKWISTTVYTGDWIPVAAAGAKFMSLGVLRLPLWRAENTPLTPHLPFNIWEYTIELQARGNDSDTGDLDFIMLLPREYAALTRMNVYGCVQNNEIWLDGIDRLTCVYNTATRDIVVGGIFTQVGNVTTLKPYEAQRLFMILLESDDTWQVNRTASVTIEYRPLFIYPRA